jgi:hypothetical protein
MTPGQPQPQAPPPQYTKGPCQACGKEMTFVLTAPKIYNEMDISLIILSHPPSRCNACSAVHVPLIKGINQEGVLEIIYKAIKVQRGPMIVGSSDQVLKDAIAAAKFSEELKNKGN